MQNYYRENELKENITNADGVLCILEDKFTPEVICQS